MSLAASWAGLAVAALFRPRWRARLSYVYSCLSNPPQVTLRVAAAWLSERAAEVLLFLLYWLVMGPCALAQRLSGEDWLGRRRKEGSMFFPRPAVADELEDLRRPY